MKDQTKAPDGYAIELWWADPKIRLWTKISQLNTGYGTVESYTIPWNLVDVVARVLDLTVDNGINLYQVFFEAFRKWERCAHPDKQQVLEVYKRVFNAIYDQCRIATTANRWTVVPLSYYGNLIKEMRRNFNELRLSGPKQDRLLLRRVRKALQVSTPLFRGSLIQLRIVNSVEKHKQPSTAELNTQVVLPPPNVTDILMRPQERTRYPIQGSATLHFMLTFRIPRPSLLYLCAQANKRLSEQNAALIVPDLLTGGAGNTAMLVVDIPELCDGYPLVSEAYPTVASHDMAYEAIRKAQILAQTVYNEIVKASEQAELAVAYRRLE